MCQAMIEALIYLKVERYLVLTLMITNGFATLMSMVINPSIPIVCRLNPHLFKGEILADGIIPSG